MLSRMPYGKNDSIFDCIAAGAETFEVMNLEADRVFPI